MTIKRLSIALTTAVLLLCANHAIAAETNAATATSVKPAASAPKAAASKASTNGKAKAKSKVKLLDINGANKAALIKLPGISEANADKIIANRPYGSKAWLVTNKVLDPATYGAIKGLVEAKQPFKTAEENAAMYEKLKKEKKAKP
jgi:DNA uptake protein ComE-like DNA-binding protein